MMVVTGIATLVIVMSKKMIFYNDRIPHKKSLLRSVKGFLWYLQESNQGHMDFQSIALPTELRYHNSALTGKK